MKTDNKLFYDEVKVSIITTSYNHEMYLADALENLINQKTSFKYEVIVHDDASTDNSADIIRQYADKYPEIIRPVLQKVNQYSQGVDILGKYMYPMARGKYIAFCEGDDYWCDEDKLQKQVDFLETHDDYSACTHNTERLNCLTNQKNILYSAEDIDIPISATMEGGKGYHTSSLVTKKEYLLDLPPFVSMIPGVLDYPLAIYLRLLGKIRRFGTVMSVYRYFSVNSWSMRISSSYERRICIYKNSIRMLKSANEYSKGKHGPLFYMEITILRAKILYHTILRYLKQISIRQRLAKKGRIENEI